MQLSCPMRRSRDWSVSFAITDRVSSAVRSEQQAAERNAQELLATEAQSKTQPEGGQKKGKKKKKVIVQL